MPGRSSPAALGSPAGCSVPPGRRLLWPHPSLSGASTDLFVFIQRIFPFQSYPGLPLRGSPIYSARLSLRAVFPTPLDQEGAFDRFFPSRVDLRQFRNGSASKIFHAIRFHVVGFTRLQSSLHVTARQVCSPCIGQDFYSRAFTSSVTIGSVEYNYAGLQSTPAAGLSPARRAALWAANETNPILDLIPLLPAFILSCRVRAPLALFSRKANVTG